MSNVAAVDMSNVAAVDMSNVAAVDMSNVAAVDMSNVAAVDMSNVAAVDMSNVAAVDMSNVAAVDMSNVAAVDMFCCAVDRTCSPSSFRCDSNAAEGHYPCISRSFVCDGTRNCLHGEDEMQDCPVRTCAPGQFRCANGICLDMRWHCDRDNDCGDFSDEPSNCSEFLGTFYIFTKYAKIVSYRAFVFLTGSC